MRWNTLFFLPKTQNWENQKIEIFGYFCAFCVYTQIFCETTIWCYVVFQKIFRDVWTPFGYLKNSPKTFFSEKNAIPQKFREKKKNRKIKQFGRSAEIGQIFFGDKNLCIRQICCMNIFWFEQ